MLTRRPLTHEEARLLHLEMQTTPNILGYTVRELLRLQDVLIADHDGGLAGACVSKDLPLGWTDIAMLYVLPAHRGRGIGGALYLEAWRRAWERGRHVFTMSRSPEVIRMMERLGMEPRGALWRMPTPVHLHMMRHMLSSWRLREAVRKGATMQTQARLVFGARRNPGPRGPAGHALGSPDGGRE